MVCTGERHLKLQGRTDTLLTQKDNLQNTVNVQSHSHRAYDTTVPHGLRHSIRVHNNKLPHTAEDTW